MYYDVIKKLNDSGRTVLEINKRNFKGSCDVIFDNLLLVEDYLNRPMNYKIHLGPKGFYIKDNIKGFSLVEKDYYIGFDLTKLFNWYFSDEFGRYLSNVSFLKDKLHLFTHIMIYAQSLNTIFDIFYNDGKEINLICMKKSSVREISTFPLKGFTLLYEYQHSLFLYRKDNNYYLVSPYRIELLAESFFNFRNIKVKHVYMDLFDLNKKTLLRELFAFNKSIKSVTIKNCNLNKEANITGWFRNCVNLEKVKLLYTPTLFDNNIMLNEVIIDKKLGKGFLLFFDADKEHEEKIKYS